MFRIFKPLVVVSSCSVASLAMGQTAELDELFAQLQDPETENWQSVEDRIQREWARSGSASRDLLLRRGREAMTAEDYEAALEHLSALIDHAPDFAEGWNARATLYFQMDRYGQSIADIEHVLALNPRHFGAMAGLATMLEQLGQYRDALSFYRAAQTLHPHRPNIDDAIARLEERLNDTAL